MSTALTSLATKEQKATVKIKPRTIRRIKTPVAEGMTVLYTSVSCILLFLHESHTIFCFNIFLFLFLVKFYHFLLVGNHFSCLSPQRWQPGAALLARDEDEKLC